VLQSKHIIPATGRAVRIIRHPSVIDRVPAPVWHVHDRAAPMRSCAQVANAEVGEVRSYRPKLVTAGIGKAAYRGGA
jgi:hypothetical protein